MRTSIVLTALPHERGNRPPRWKGGHRPLGRLLTAAHRRPTMAKPRSSRRRFAISEARKGNLWCWVLCCPLLLSGCIYIPLPDQAPPLQEVRVPQTGDLASDVRRVFGDPQVLDSGRFLFYDWTTDRGFLIVPAYPTGLPGGAVIAKHRFRMGVMLDETQRVARVECSMEGAEPRQLETTGCLMQETLTSKAKLAEWVDLAQVDGLAGVRFWRVEATGSNTEMVLSPDGTVLAATDTENRTWLVDLERLSVMNRHDNTEPNFWSLKGVPLPRSAFSADGRHLFISQGETSVLLVRDGDQFRPVRQLVGHDLRVARFTCCPERIVGLGAARMSEFSLDGMVLGHIEGEGRVRFGLAGAAITETVPPGTSKVVALSTAKLVPSPRAVFGEHDARNAVLDTRNDSARQRAFANFEFSPGGRWLARNSCRHVELWESRLLAAVLSDNNAPISSPAKALMMPLPAEATDEFECHGPITFRSDGRKVAAASTRAIHVWDIDAGRPELLIDVRPLAYGLHIVAIGFSSRDRLTAVVSDYRGTIFVGRWEVTLSQ
jgi:hypothetical protein